MKNKLSILLPHKNRAILTLKTIQMYHYWLENQNELEYEIIVADDDSYDSECESLRAYAGRRIVMHSVTRKHTGSQSVIAHNEMVDRCTGNILLISQAETYPANDIFAYFAKNISTRQYFVGACWALSPIATMKALSLPAEKIPELFNTNLIDKWPPRYGEWYQHSEHRNRQLHFATLMHIDDWYKVGGMPREYENSVGKEDVEFLRRVKEKGIQVVSQDNMLFYHQNHYGGLYENGHDGFRKWNV